jgi:tRNA pseudouridine38-40 synthase
MPTRNIKLTIEYDGSHYCGWQVQPRQTSIQAVLETAIKKIVNEPIKLTAAGRTDAGVHALGQVANFKTSCAIPVPNLIPAINSKLPSDIVVKNAHAVAFSFNARRDAKYRTYQYRIYNHQIPNAFQHNYSYFYPFPLNLTRMRKAAKYFIGIHDFSAFNASPGLVKHSVRQIHTLRIRREKEMVIITIQANAFIHNMVRIIVGTLLDIGRGRINPDEVNRIILSKQRKNAGMTVPAQGLFLVEVKY